MATAGSMFPIISAAAGKRDHVIDHVMDFVKHVDALASCNVCSIRAMTLGM